MNTFNQVMYDKYDAVGKAKAIEVWRNLCGMRAEENPDRYGIDLLVFNGEGKHFAWCEVSVQNLGRLGRTMLLPIRRRWQMQQRKPVYYFKFNSSLDYLQTTESSRVKKYASIEDRGASGVCYVIPESEVKLFRVGELPWTQVIFPAMNLSFLSDPGGGRAPTYAHTSKGL